MVILICLFDELLSNFGNGFVCFKLVVFVIKASNLLFGHLFKPFRTALCFYNLFFGFKAGFWLCLMQTFCYNCLWIRSFSPKVIKWFRWDFAPITHWLMSTHDPLLKSPMSVLRLRKTLSCQEKFFAWFWRKHFPLEFELLEINIWRTDVSTKGCSGLGDIARQSSVVICHLLLFSFGHWKECCASYAFRQLIFEGLLVKGSELNSLEQLLVWNACFGSAQVAFESLAGEGASHRGGTLMRHKAKVAHSKFNLIF